MQFPILRICIWRSLLSSRQAPRQRGAVTVSHRLQRQHIRWRWLPLFTKDTLYNFEETHIFVMKTTKDDIVPLKNEKTEIFLNIPTTESKFPTERAENTYCKIVTQQVGCPGSGFYVNHDELLIRNAIVGKAAELVVLELIKNKCCPCHVTTNSRHPGRSSMIVTSW